MKTLNPFDLGISPSQSQGHCTFPSQSQRYCGKVKDIAENFNANEHIYIDISANPTQILTEYSLLHVPCPRGCSVCIRGYLEQI